jgi:hypothetical protein
MRKVYHGILLQAQEGILVWLIALHLGTPGGKQSSLLWLEDRIWLMKFHVMDFITSIHLRTFVILSAEPRCEINIRTSGNGPEMKDHDSLHANQWHPLVL